MKLMPFGKFKDRPIAEMETAYLAWLVTNDHVRFKRWPFVKAALAVLRSRFDNFDSLLAELKVENEPPKRWLTPERAAAKARERTAKLRILEARRAEEKAAKQAAQREAYRAQLEEEKARRQPVDAFEFVRAARRNAAPPADGSDLV